MRINLILLSLICVLALVFVTPVQAVLVDDFSVPGLPEYTLSVVNNGNTAPNVQFSDATGVLLESYVAGVSNAFEQVLLLRDDYNLPVGKRLLVDVSGTLGNFDRDIGIAVGWTTTPPSTPNASGDVRTSYVEVSSRGNSQVVSYARFDAVNLGSGQEFSGTSYGGRPAFTSLVDQLFIDRLTATKFRVGWVDNGVESYLTNNGNVISPFNNPPVADGHIYSDYTYDFAGAVNVPGAAIGFYGDLRTVLAATPYGLDNLQIVDIPEPATSVMALIGALGMGLIWLRKRG